MPLGVEPPADGADGDSLNCSVLAHGPPVKKCAVQEPVGEKIATTKNQSTAGHLRVRNVPHVVDSPLQEFYFRQALRLSRLPPACPRHAAARSAAFLRASNLLIGMGRIIGCNSGGGS